MENASPADPVRRQERLDPAVWKAEQVLRTYDGATQLTQRTTRLAQTALAVRDVLRRARSRLASLMHHCLNVAVACRDEDKTDGAATLKYALDETTGAERLVVGMWSDNDETLTCAHL